MFIYFYFKSCRQRPGKYIYSNISLQIISEADLQLEKDLRPGKSAQNHIDFS